MSCAPRREQDEMVCSSCGLRWTHGEDKPLCQPLILTPAEERLHAVMSLNKDTYIAEMYDALAGARQDRVRGDDRTSQQFVGAHVTRLNRKLEDRGLVIVPGVARRTYTLKHLD